MEYEQLSKEDFDALVTGELTHFSLWFEQAIIDIITKYFLRRSKRADDFKRLLLWRDGLTFQDKIEVLRAMIPLFGAAAAEVQLKNLLRRVEDFKSFRNAFAHGHDVSEEESTNHLKIHVVSRSGKSKTIEVTPATHTQLVADAEILLKSLQTAQKKLSKT